jgi:hypothetical protein
MTDTTYNVMKPDKGVPIKAWTEGCPARGRCASAATYRVVLCARSGRLASGERRAALRRGKPEDFRGRRSITDSESNHAADAHNYA